MNFVGSAKINVVHTFKKQIMQCTSFSFAKRWHFGFAKSIVAGWSCRKKVGQSGVGLQNIGGVQEGWKISFVK